MPRRRKRTAGYQPGSLRRPSCRVLPIALPTGLSGASPLTRPSCDCSTHPPSTFVIRLFPRSLAYKHWRPTRSDPHGRWVLPPVRRHLPLRGSRLLGSPTRRRPPAQAGRPDAFLVLSSIFLAFLNSKFENGLDEGMRGTRRERNER